MNRQNQTVSRAARVVLALRDDDLDAAVRVLTEASTTGGLGALRDVALALGQMTADRISEESVAELVARSLDAESTR
ncbi:hypothetical protein [Gordonia sp. OPL2]|uniref:hypothetical protein n=1 Tax=Gordonia sp. OPL2 TaxID=2486274 RepID=UPI001654F5D1|nr:hypothetical protein [Gordonia sp. OPL2]RPA20006.1 hypothetical protein EEB19_02960 [Gordonia sp. OPL2]